MKISTSTSFSFVYSIVLAAAATFSLFQFTDSAAQSRRTFADKELYAPPELESCRFRCLARCLETERNLTICENDCRSYKSPNLCSLASGSNRTECRSNCTDLLGPPPVGEVGRQLPPVPSFLYATYWRDVDDSPKDFDPYRVLLTWDAVDTASDDSDQPPVTGYIILERDNDTLEGINSWKDGGRRHYFVHKNEKIIERSTFVCKPTVNYRLYSVNRYGISRGWVQADLKPPTPNVTAKELGFKQESLVMAFDSKYDREKDEVLNVSVIRATFNINFPKYWKGTEFKFPTNKQVNFGDPKSVSLGTVGGACQRLSLKNVQMKLADEKLSMELPSSVLRGKNRGTCIMIVKLEALLLTCGTKIPVKNQLPLSLFITCSNVKNASCNGGAGKPNPACRFNRKFTVIAKDGRQRPPNETLASEVEDLENMSINVTWDLPDIKRNKEPIKYYQVQFGSASPHMIETLGISFDVPGDGWDEYVNFDPNLNDTVIRYSCNQTDRDTCARPKNWMVFDNVRADKLYGIRVCGVYSKYKAPDFSSEAIQIKKIDFNFKKKPGISSFKLGMYIGLPLLSALLFVLCIIAGICRHLKNQTTKMKILQDTLERQDAYSAERYTECPKKGDDFEISRRQIKVFDDEKLGAGAFGSVYKGKVMGKLLAHKDSQSVVATNIMRTENSEVAIKMLPEYADDLSKADFLKEINLMKQLGYHERLVNMLACVTESEPYLLIVEYCDGGDLLRFLRDRRKYMMKLDDLGIDYTSIEEGSESDSVDHTMILSLKELLGYSLQISYGLEYLSQKGFIHRDVAARNVLIHQKRFAKIGDFGLCRFVHGNDAAYWGKGGRLPIKWMAPEAIKNYEFSSLSDVWSFGVLLFEIITMGGCPYPGIQPADMEFHLEAGNRMEQPDNCPDDFYAVMNDCWEFDPAKRISFSDARTKLASMLEEVVIDYSYLTLDAQRDYYNVQYTDYGGDPNGDSDQEQQGSSSSTQKLNDDIFERHNNRHQKCDSSQKEESKEDDNPRQVAVSMSPGKSSVKRIVEPSSSTTLMKSKRPERIEMSDLSEATGFADDVTRNNVNWGATDNIGYTGDDSDVVNSRMGQEREDLQDSGFYFKSTDSIDITDDDGDDSDDNHQRRRRQSSDTTKHISPNPPNNDLIVSQPTTSVSDRDSDSIGSSASSSFSSQTTSGAPPPAPKLAPRLKKRESIDSGMISASYSNSTPTTNNNNKNPERNFSFNSKSIIKPSKTVTLETIHSDPDSTGGKSDELTVNSDSYHFLDGDDNDDDKAIAVAIKREPRTIVNQTYDQIGGGRKIVTNPPPSESNPTLVVQSSNSQEVAV